MVPQEVKQLDRNTVAVLFEIRAPIWNGGKKMVGLNLARVRKHNEIHFTYRRKTGNAKGDLSIPEKYYFDGDNLKGLDYEIQNIKGVSLVLIPFSHLQILERV